MNLNISRELIKLDNILLIKRKYEDDSDIQKILINDALIYVYTFYEQSIKNIYMELYAKHEENFKSNPLIIGHRCREPKWVAPTKSDELITYFPLLKEWHFFTNDKNVKKIDGLITCRHEYAHTGNTQIVLENIYSCFSSIIRIITFLKVFYLRDVERETMDKKIDFLKKDNYIYCELTKLDKKFYGQINNNCELIPEGLKLSFNNLNEKIIGFNADIDYENMEERLSSLLIMGSNNFYESIRSFNIEDDFNSTYFNGLLTEYKRISTYKFPMYDSNYERIVLREYRNDSFIIDC